MCSTAMLQSQRFLPQANKPALKVEEETMVLPGCLNENVPSHDAPAGAAATEAWHRKSTYAVATSLQSSQINLIFPLFGKGFDFTLLEF